MKSISEIFVNDNILLKDIDNFFKKYIGCSLLHRCNIIKIVDEVFKDNQMNLFDNPIFRIIGNPEHSDILTKVVSARDLLIDKLRLCFYPSSAYRMFANGDFYGNYKKDTFYRFDLLPKANWERLQFETAGNVIADIESETDDHHVNALVFDDSLYQRRRGKGTELCAKVYDHIDHKLRLGYRMMTGGWTNGEVFIPFSQSLLTTQDKNLMVGPDNPSDLRTVQGKRRALAKTKGPDVVLNMVDRAQKVGIPFDYVLFDTWFSNPSLLISLKNKKVDVIAMIKKDGKKYICDDPATGEECELNVKEIYKKNKKRRGRSKYLLSVNVTIKDAEGNNMPAKIVYTRNRNNRKKWICFICTDLDQDEEKILNIYMMRHIETYFKIVKNHLKLRTECHSPNYDAITAHMIIVSIRYMILALARFNNTDNRTIDDLFYRVQREVINEMIERNVLLLLDIMIESTKEYCKLNDNQVDDLVCIFIDKLPDEWKYRFDLSEAS